MEKKRNSCRNACEKFFKSITVRSPFRTLRLISHHPQDSMPANPTPSTSILNVKTRPAAQHLKTPKNKEAAGIVPIKFANSTLANEKAKTAANPYAPVNGQLANVAPKPRADMTEEEKNVIRKGKIEPEPHLLSFQQKLKPMADKTPPAHAIGNNGGRSHGHHGVKTYGKVDPSQVSSIESNKMGPYMEDRFTDYINRAKIKIRTTSSVDEKNASDENQLSASGQDDGNDQFSDYINRAKKKMLRTMTSFIGGRSDSMK